MANRASRRQQTVKMMGHGRPMKAIRGTGETAPRDLEARISACGDRHRVWAVGQDEPRGTEPISMTWPQCLRCELKLGPRLMKLAPLEHSLLRALLFNHRSLSIDELIEAMWPDPDYEPEWANNSVKVYVSRLRAKGIGLATQYGFVRLAERHRHG